MIKPEKIRDKAFELGFSGCGFARAEPLDLGNKVDFWLSNNFHGRMNFLERNKEMRLNPASLFPGTETVIVLKAPYFQEDYVPEGKNKISRYAVGRDYHKVLKKRGQSLINWMQGFSPDASARIFVDSAPIMEKEWARRAGLGWIGKNTCLITRGEGSWFFLAVILTSLKIEPDKPENNNFCGKCTRCIDACPTKAIHPDGFVNASACISYLTIELKGQIPPEFKGKTDNWLFGCDICQEVCPHNKFHLNSEIPDFKPKTPVLNFSTLQISDLTEEDFAGIFAGSPLKRAGLEKLKRTISFLNDAE